MAKKKLKIPKRVAGIKLGKKSRKNLGSLLTLVAHPDGRQLLGSAGGALLGFLASRTRRKGQAKHA